MNSPRRIITTEPGSEHEAMVIRFGVTDDDYAVVFTLDTGWLVPGGDPYDFPPTKPVPLDLGYHSSKPIQGYTRFQSCQWTGGECYYDGSSMWARDAYQVLVTRGIDALWEFLEGEMMAFRERVEEKSPMEVEQ